MSRRKEIPNLIKKVMLLLAGIQVLLGGIWLVCNLTYMPDFQETRDMLKASETMVFDEYMGVLYPVLLRLCSVFGDGFYVPVYLLQTGLAIWSYYYFLCSIAGGNFANAEKKYLWLLVGYFVTFPVILQAHMSVLPYSLATSLLVFMTTEIKYLIENKEVVQKKRLLTICILWLLVGLLIPDYGFIALFLVVTGFVWAGWRQRKKILLYLGIVVVTFAAIFTTLTLTQTPGSYGRVQRSVNSVLWTRFAWPHFERDGFYWDHKVWIEFADGEWGWISMYPENAIYEFGPKIEGVVGKEQADAIFGEMATLSFNMGMKDALKALGRDVLANVGGPFALQYQLSGKGVSYTGWNYYQMQGNAPGLTKYFVRYAMYSFDFLFVLTLGIVWSRRKKCKMQDIIKKAVPALLGLSVMILWYTMIGNGMQDYLKVLPVIFFWCVLPVIGVRELHREEAESSIE